MTSLVLDGSVINDNKLVETITDRGEAAYRRRPGHGHRKDIKIDKLRTTDSIDVVEQLYNARVDFDPEHGIWFIPRASFDVIITPEVTAQIIDQLACYQTMSPDGRIQVASDIYYGKDSGSGAPGPPCRKLLATLIGVNGYAKTFETVEEIKRHMDEGMNDDCLPLLDNGDRQLICRLHDQGHPFINHAAPGRGQWQESFVRWSRALMAPYILWEEGPKSLHRHYVMHGGGPLPMAPVMQSSEPHVHHGGFGDILKVRIQPGDRNFQSSRVGFCKDRNCPDPS